MGAQDTLWESRTIGVKSYGTCILHNTHTGLEHEKVRDVSQLKKQNTIYSISDLWLRALPLFSASKLGSQRPRESEWY